MIDVINLKKSFGGLEVLKGVNITINKGDIVAVLGPSGSGKKHLSAVSQLYGGSDVRQYYF